VEPGGPGGVRGTVADRGEPVYSGCVRPVARISARAWSAAALCALGAIAGGCYQRTVAVRGPGAERTAVQEPYQETWMIDNLLLGEDPSRKPSKGAKPKAKPRSTPRD